MVAPSTQTLLTVILILIAANSALAVTLLLLPRLRRRRQALAEADRPAARAGSPDEAGPRTMVPVFAAAGAAPTIQADPQTGLDVAATWHRWLREEETRVRRYRRPATLVLVEVDGLDRLAERLGSAAADRLIPPIAATMRRHARDADRVARLAPGRFAALLPETDEDQAANFVARIRAACDLWLAAGAISLRLSIGWSACTPARSMEVALETAEERLNAERHRDRDAAELVERVPEPDPFRTS